MPDTVPPIAMTYDDVLAAVDARNDEYITPEMLEVFPDVGTVLYERYPKTIDNSIATESATRFGSVGPRNGEVIACVFMVAGGRDTLTVRAGCTAKLLAAGLDELLKPTQGRPYFIE